MRDGVDEIQQQWQQQRPDVDTRPMGVIGRLSRVTRLIEHRLRAAFAEQGLQPHEFDILATLRRSGAPYQLNAGQLMQASMVTSGAITNRIDRLVDKGWVERETDPDNRRSVHIRLTEPGLEKVDSALAKHLATEASLLTSLSTTEQIQLSRLLRTLSIDLGDRPVDKD